jgi:hypothetical protein
VLGEETLVSPQALPLTRDEFLAMFGACNQAIWPMHIVAFTLAITTVALAMWHFHGSDRVISAIPAAFWVWVGGVFFPGFQRVLDASPISTVATVAFVLQGLLWLWFGVVRGRLTFGTSLNLYGIVGGAAVRLCRGHLSRPELSGCTHLPGEPLASTWGPSRARRRSSPSDCCSGQPVLSPTGCWWCRSCGR